MVQPSPDQSVETRHAIWRMYRDSADEDYLMARFAARANLQYQFWWNAQQATEKYLKASLLINGRAVDSRLHKLSKMFDDLVGICGDLLPHIHCPPREISHTGPILTLSRFTEVRKFIEALETKGDPNNRYRAFSIWTHWTDLLHLDEICFCLRRVTFTLDMVVEGHDRTAREVLIENRALQLHPKLAFKNDIFDKGEAAEERSELFRWCNFAYFPNESVEAGQLPKFGGSTNAAPYMAIKNGTEESLAAIEWIANHAFPKKLRLSVMSSVGDTRLKSKP